MTDPDRLCMRCMSRLAAPHGVCRYCGQNNARAENAPHHLPCGSVLAGDFLVGLTLGQGGFGITYVGWDLKLEMKVAIKEFYPEGIVTRDPLTRSEVRVLTRERETFFQKGKDRFFEEARTLARFSAEKGIVGVRRCFNANGTAYIVQDFVEGETLKAYAAERGGKLPAAEVLEKMRPLCASLQTVHKSGLLHRDISPDNIMVQGDGSLVLIDFGAAREMSAYGEHSNTINVKHGYAPEEQYLTHGNQGSWTDVYAFCATIYRLTTGVTPPQALERLTNDVPLISPNQLGAGFTPEQEQALLRGLAIKAKDRTRDMAALIEDLFEARAQTEVQVESPTKDISDQNRGRTPKKKKKKPWHEILSEEAYKRVFILEILGLLILLGVLAWREKWFSGLFTGGALPAPTTLTVAADSPEPAPLLTAASTAEPTIEPEPTPTQAPTASIPDTPDPETLYHDALATAKLYKGRITAGADFTLAVDDDGRVYRFGGSGIHADEWTQIMQVAAYEFTAVGLRYDGTVVVTGQSDFGEANVGDWTDVMLVDCGYRHTVGLTADGRVLYAGVNKGNRASCKSWTDLSEIIAGAEQLIGITYDGEVYAAGYDDLGACETDSFENIVGGDVGGLSTFCIRSDGTVIAIGRNVVGEDDVQEWTDIVAIAAGDEHTVGLRADGTVVAVGSNSYGECNVSRWTDIIAIAAGKRHTIGLKSDGTLVSTGSDSTGQCDVSGIRLW